MPPRPSTDFHTGLTDSLSPFTKEDLNDCWALGDGTQPQTAVSGDSHGPGTVKIRDQSKQSWDFCLNDLLSKGSEGMK